MRLYALLIFAIVFGTIAYALEPVPVNLWVSRTYHRIVDPTFGSATKSSLAVRTVIVAGDTFRVEVADTDASRFKGLSDRSSLGSERGMLFTFPRADRYAFTMRGMRFPLDFVWVRAGTVVGVTENVPAPGTNGTPQLVDPPAPVDSVLEVPAGTVGRVGIASGQALTVSP